MRLALAQVVAWAWVFVLAARLLTDLGRAPAR
jgi:hypothetical protein